MLRVERKRVKGSQQSGGGKGARGSAIKTADTSLRQNASSPTHKLFQKREGWMRLSSSRMLKSTNNFPANHPAKQAISIGAVRRKMKCSQKASLAPALLMVPRENNFCRTVPPQVLQYVILVVIRRCEMATVKTALSIREALFQQANKLADEMNISRSRLFSMALEEYLLRHENHRLLNQLNHALPEQADDIETERMDRMRRIHRSRVEGEW
jgi:hypothetical protein